MLQLFFPLVSVIIPAYNAELFIEETLKSVLAQTYQRLEVLVVDDGSSDRTAEIVQHYAGWDSRIRLIQQANAGVAAARNRGIQEARGQFVAPVDADDIWYPQALELMVQRFAAASEETGVVYSWSVDIDEMGQRTGGFHAATLEGKVLKTLLCHNFLGNASSSLIRRSCFERVGGYDEQLKEQNAQGCEDWDLYLRLAEHYAFTVVPKFLVGYRKLPSGMSADFSKMARSQSLMLSRVRKHHPEIPAVLYQISRSSFYLYLAQQSHINGNMRDALSWLGQTIRVDPLTPFCRPGFYLLAVSSFIRLVWESLRPHQVKPPNSKQLGADILLQLSQASLSSDAPIHQLQLQIKLWVSSLLHQSLLRI